MKTLTLRKLVRQAVRYGLKPEDLGGPSIINCNDYMKGWLKFMEGWEQPSAYGCTEQHRERATKAWDKLLSRKAK